MILKTYDDVVRHLHFFSDKKLWIEVDGKEYLVINVQYTTRGLEVQLLNNAWLTAEEVYSELEEKDFRPKKQKRVKKPLTKESKRSKIKSVKKIGQGRAWL
jgi:hypothetical protein